MAAGLAMPSFAAEQKALSPAEKIGPTMNSTQALGTMSSAQKTGFMTWTVAQKPLSHEYKGTLAVGTILPSTILFTAVPAEFGPTTMQWAVVNHRTLLINPTTRTVTQILD
jgi:hypothetical protein